MNEETKGLIQSKTVWGVIVQVLAMLAMHFGYDIGDQGMVVNVAIAVIGAGMSVWGRITAVKKIG